ncbi:MULTISPECIES: hypothetical protein [unclassified Bradyrhizobium]|uniref:hypothetical protein n=1 Tax=unclassified Bradyrhizobium TaxID=2631580 RepID=UPI002FF3AA05
MDDAVRALLTLVGLVFGAGGGIAVVAYGILRFFGEKWMNAKFEERLAAFKHAQEKELEELRYKINALMDRTIKLHQKEFDVVPEAWGKLTQAHGIVMTVTSSIQQYPDLDRMAAGQLEEFLEGGFLARWQKDELKEVDQRNEYYQRACTLHRIWEAREACWDFHIYFKKNGIFVPEPIKAKFLHLDKLIYDALIEHQINEQEEIRPRLRENTKRLSEAEEIMNTLEQDIQHRLWSTAKSDERIKQM